MKSNSARLILTAGLILAFFAAMFSLQVVRAQGCGVKGSLPCKPPRSAGYTGARSYPSASSH